MICSKEIPNSLLGKPSDYEGGEDHGSLSLDVSRACKLHIVWRDSARPRPASQQGGGLKSRFSDSGPWIHKGLLTNSRRNECQGYTGAGSSSGKSDGGHRSKKN